MFKHFEEDIIQDKKIRLKKEYWLFYLLTFLAGARRQIFVVFAGFLLVEKFGVDIHNMVVLLLILSLMDSLQSRPIRLFRMPSKNMKMEVCQQVATVYTSEMVMAVWLDQLVLK